MKELEHTIIFLLKVFSFFSNDFSSYHQAMGRIPYSQRDKEKEKSEEKNNQPKEVKLSTASDVWSLGFTISNYSFFFNLQRNDSL
jgi:hypothetical protein